MDDGGKRMIFGVSDVSKKYDLNNGLPQSVAPPSQKGKNQHKYLLQYT